MLPAVLIVDDQEPIHLALGRTLRREPCEVLHAYDADEAAGILAHRADVRAIICDHYMPGTLGLEFMLGVRREYPEIVTILLTAQADVGMVIAAMDEGRLHQFMTKPWDADELRAMIRAALGAPSDPHPIRPDAAGIRAAQLARAMAPQVVDDESWILTPIESDTPTRARA